jgi:hypothetical protein
MDPISQEQLYELYLDTVRRCTSDLRNQSDEDIQYQLFEQFDVGAHTFLHEQNLEKLRLGGWIDSEMLLLSKEIRRRWLKLQEVSWTIEDIRTKSEWRELFELCDRVSAMARRTDSDT